jgi:hypothetical protein
VKQASGFILNILTSPANGDFDFMVPSADGTNIGFEFQEVSKQD